MKLTVNGKPHTHDDVSTIASLLELLEVRGRRVAVMVNDDVVPKARFAEFELHEGDRVEIINMVGGG